MTTRVVLNVLAWMVGLGGVAFAVQYPALTFALTGLSPALVVLGSTVFLLAAIVMLSWPSPARPSDPDSSSVREFRPRQSELQIAPKCDNQTPAAFETARTSLARLSRDVADTPTAPDAPAPNPRYRAPFTIDRHVGAFTPIFALDRVDLGDVYAVAIAGWLLLVLAVCVVVWWSDHRAVFLRWLPWRKSGADLLSGFDAALVSPLGGVLLAQAIPHRRQERAVPDFRARFEQLRSGAASPGCQATGSSSAIPRDTSTAEAPSAIPSAESTVSSRTLGEAVEQVARALHLAHVVQALGAGATLEDRAFELLTPPQRERYLNDALVVVREGDPYRRAAAMLAAQRIAGNGFERGLAAYYAHLFEPGPAGSRK